MGAESMKPFAYAVTLAGSKRTWLILASDEDALQPMRDAGIEMSIQPLYAQEPPPIQLSEEQTANAILLAYMLTTSDRFGNLMPSCQFAPEKLRDVAPGIVDGIELTEAGKALKQRMVQMMHDARVKGGA
jgi:hypothetical protein